MQHLLKTSLATAKLTPNRKTAASTVLFLLLFGYGISLNSSNSLAQGTTQSSPTKIGVIETKELSKLVLERMEALKKSESEKVAPPPAKFVLVDVRSDREMSISIIPGAISQSEFEKNQAKYSQMVVIPYCTVGGRCGEFSKQLAQAGWTVRSYRGSIVEWVQNELPLVNRKGQPTNQLHTNGGSFKLPKTYEAISR